MPLRSSCLTASSASVGMSSTINTRRSRGTRSSVEKGLLPTLIPMPGHLARLGGDHDRRTMLVVPCMVQEPPARSRPHVRCTLVVRRIFDVLLGAEPEIFQAPGVGRPKRDGFRASVLAHVPEIDSERAELAVQMRALHADPFGQLPD